MTGTEKTTSSIQRRLETPMTLTFTWFLTACVFIGTGVFYILHYIFYLILKALPSKTLFNYFTILRIRNIYNISSTHIHYYIDVNTVRIMIIPAIIALIAGIVMLIIRNRNFAFYTGRELDKIKKK